MIDYRSDVIENVTVRFKVSSDFAINITKRATSCRWLLKDQTLRIFKIAHFGLLLTVTSEMKKATAIVEMLRAARSAYLKMVAALVAVYGTLEGVQICKLIFFFHIFKEKISKLEITYIVDVENT